MQVKGRILAIDDDPDNITIVEELLGDDHDIKTATTGEQALRIAQNFRPDLILLDIMMPGMNGYEICRRLREDCSLKCAKIIMVSARAMVSEQLEGYGAGADDYITKPFDADELLAKIQAFLCLRHAEEIDRARHETIIAAVGQLRFPVIVAKNIISDVVQDISGQVNPKLCRLLGIAGECVDRMEATINNFLDMPEIDTGEAELQLSLFSVQSLVLEVLDLFKPKADLMEISLISDMPGDELLISADRVKIAKALGNLIDNAFNLTHEGSAIYVRVRDLHSRIVVDVEGNEPGTDAGKADEFFKRPPRMKKHVGTNRHRTGFGLAAARRFVEMHGGRIFAESESEGEAAFSFEIPTCTEHEMTTQPALSDTGAHAAVCEQSELMDRASEHMT